MTDRNEREEQKEISKQEREHQEPIQDLQPKKADTDEQVRGGNIGFAPEPE